MQHAKQTNLSNKARKGRRHVIQYIDVGYVVRDNCPRSFRLFRLIFALILPS